MSHQTTAWLAPPAPSQIPPEARATDSANLPTWLTTGLLVLASVVLFALASASAWLSYHAQVSYVLAHNGGRTAEAKVWAFLLDAGTAGVSLLRLYETLRGRSGVATRFSLVGCVAASVTMNILHTPSRTPGGLLVAAVPPLMYAGFLEHLLTNLRSLLLADQERRSLWRAVVLWLNFPSLMWSKRRELLRRDAEDALPEVERVLPGVASTRCATSDTTEVPEQRQSGAARKLNLGGPVRRTRRGRGPGPKRVAFETALADQVRCGDLRLFSEDERERNAAAYDAAASLPAPLSRGTARRYVVQALPRLEVSGAVAELPEADANLELGT